MQHDAAAFSFQPVSCRLAAVDRCVVENDMDRPLARMVALELGDEFDGGLLPAVPGSLPRDSSAIQMNGKVMGLPTTVPTAEAIRLLHIIIVTAAARTK
jgi:hypothetical protein